MGKLTISMLIFHSYVKLPEGIRPHKWNQDILNEQSAERRILSLNLCFCCCKSQLRPGLAPKTSNVGYQVFIEHYEIMGWTVDAICALFQRQHINVLSRKRQLKSSCKNWLETWSYHVLPRFVVCTMRTLPPTPLGTWLRNDLAEPPATQLSKRSEPLLAS